MLNVFRNYKKLSDAELMRRFQNDDSKAFEEIFNRYESRLLGFFISFLSNKQEAEDLLHDFFIKIIEKKHLYNPQFALQPWLFKIASNQAKSYIKKLKRLPLDEINSVELPEFESGANRKLIQKNIRTALKELDDTHRITFILRHYNNLSVKEIAQILECKEGTVKSRLFTANQRLKSILIKQEITLEL